MFANVLDRVNERWGAKWDRRRSINRCPKFLKIEILRSPQLLHHHARAVLKDESYRAFKFPVHLERSRI